MTSCLEECGDGLTAAVAFGFPPPSLHNVAIRDATKTCQLLSIPAETLW